MPRIKFLEESHRYLTEDNQDLISVSKFAAKFKEKQDWTAIAKKVAAKETKAGNPMTLADVQKKWERKRILSSEIGTLYHNIREAQLLEGDKFYDVACSMKHCEHSNGAKYSIPITSLENNTVYPELMIYDIDYMICGQADKIIVTNNKINVWDYKTDKEITFKAYSSEWVKPRMFLPPINKIQEANGNEYAIKMSLYMYLLWKANKGRFQPGDLIIEHIHLKRDVDNDGIAVIENGVPVVEKIEQIRLPYLKKEVMAMLETIKS